MALPSTHWTTFDRPGVEPALDWERFGRAYREPVRQWFLAKRVPDADADDLTQQVLLKLFENLGRYDRERGAFRPWLRTLLGHALADFHRTRQRRPGHVAAGGSAALELLAGLAAEESVAELADRVDERGQALLATALEHVQATVKEPTWRAFEQLVQHGRPARDVAAECGLSVGAVHQARYRLLPLIRREYERLAAGDEAP